MKRNMNVTILRILKKKPKTVYVCVCIYMQTQEYICIYGTKRSEMGKEVAWGKEGLKKKETFFYSLQQQCLFTTMYIFSSMNSATDVQPEKRRTEEKRSEDNADALQFTWMGMSSRGTQLSGSVPPQPAQCAWITLCTDTQF